MNAERVLQSMPAAMGSVYRCPYTEIWLCMSVVPECDTKRPKRITAFQKEKRRSERRREIVRQVLKVIFVVVTGMSYLAAIALGCQLAGVI